MRKTLHPGAVPRMPHGDGAVMRWMLHMGKMQTYSDCRPSQRGMRISFPMELLL